MWQLSVSDATWLWREVAGLFGERSLARIEKMLQLLSDNGGIVGGNGVQGTKQLWLPNLPSRPWHSPGDFEWTDRLERAWESVASELQGLLADGAQFREYLGDPAPAAGTIADGALGPPERGWKAFSFCRDGGWNAATVRRCPATMAALEAAPVGHGDVIFSLLEPRTAIPAHYGLDNLRLTCHLGLQVPADCGIEVGGEVRRWQPGRCLIFDDTFEHRAWNASETPRTVLLFDFWHPGLSQTERAALRYLLPEIRRRNPGARA